MFDLEDLRTFVMVADAGGVTAGARRLGLSKSIVSRRLVRLEQELGIQLLSRTTRGAALTEAGATFREHAARVATELDAARDALSQEGDVRGLLRVAAPLTFGPTHVAPVLAELAHRHPQLRIHAAYSDRFVDLIGEGFDAPALDTLFLAAPISYDGLLLQCAGRVIRTAPGKDTAEVHDYHDRTTPILATSLPRRMPGYRTLRFTKA